jgi:hypothetical protein
MRGLKLLDDDKKLHFPHFYDISLRDLLYVMLIPTGIFIKPHVSRLKPTLT